jgi:hypothetical protein
MGEDNGAMLNTSLHSYRSVPSAMESVQGHDAVMNLSGFDRDSEVVDIHADDSGFGDQIDYGRSYNSPYLK